MSDQEESLLRTVAESWTVLDGGPNIPDESPRISPSIADYDLSADSLAAEISKMNRLITDFNANLQAVDAKLGKLDARLSAFEDQLTVAMEHIEEDRRVRVELASDLKGTVDTMSKIKPLVKAMHKRIADMEARDLRQENWNIRQGIPFNFKPQHLSSGSSAGMLLGVGLRNADRSREPAAHCELD